jgi:type I restriction enzyme M protein
MNNFQEKVGFIWSVADLLRGDYKQSDYGKVILPLTVLRRLDCVLEKTKDKVLAKAANLPARADEAMKELMLCQAAGLSFYNLSRFVFQATDAVDKSKPYVSLFADPGHLAANLNNYLTGFSPVAREIFIDKFKFGEHVERLDASNLLFLVLGKFVAIDLHPDRVDNVEMGYVFEELIRRFSEQSNETAGEHFTPREVIRLMVNLLFAEDDDALRKKGVIRTLYDPACGTGGMLSVAENYLRDLNRSATLKVFGQELNPESYAICKSDMLIKGEDASNIKFGNSFTQDGLPGGRFDYFLSNPPFGVEWRKVERAVRDEHEKLGMAGRFGAGLPRITDGSLLFLQHMVSKFKHGKSGSRLAIVFNGSPLFTGGAGSGESEVRRWVIENDWLEAIVALPEQLFYNTGIATYVWVVTNRKSPERRGKVQLVNAASYFVKMRKSLGDKRNEIGDGTSGKPDQIAEITRIYGEFKPGPLSQVFDNEDFGYWRVAVERPLRLNFAVTPERLARVKNLSVRAALAELAPEGVFKDREKFAGRLRATLKSGGVTLTPAALKGVIASLGERDETAEVCRDAKGQPEPDPDLRDYENVPLKDDIQAYFDREVRPHVPDAWIDESKTKKGYEIPFSRHFYEYTPLRPLGQIEAEIMALEGEIQRMLKGAMA